MSRSLKFVTAFAALSLIGGLSSAPVQAKTVPPTAFGMHDIGITAAVWPTVPTGAVRIWDTDAQWGQVNTSKGKYDWSKLDAAISNAEAHDADILYVLSATPVWAAKNKRKYPDALPYPGASTPPAKMKYWTDWVQAVTKRYGNRIDSYQVWNEPSIKTFWQGSVSQIGAMTVKASKIIRKNAPGSKVVSASTTVRWEPGFRKFFPSYLNYLKKKKWPVDVISAHMYPKSNGTPSTYVGFIKQVKADMKRYSVPKRIKLWDTEMNYGLAGLGYPDEDIAGTQAASYVAQTYLYDLIYGIERTYWYAWTAKTDLLGIQMTPGSAGSDAFALVQSWVVGKDVKCTSKGGLNSCEIADGGIQTTVLWTDHGAQAVSPPSGDRMCTADGDCRNTPSGPTVQVTTLPVWFGPKS